KDWAGMALDPATNSLFVSGGGQLPPIFFLDMKKNGASEQAMENARKPLIRLALKEGSLQTQPSLAIQGLPETERFIAGIAAAPGGVLYVVNTENDTVYRLSGDGYATQVSTKVGYRPYAVAVAPGGQTIAVSNWGDESVSLLDAKTLQPKALVKVGSHPNEMTFGKDGRLWVACSGSNSVSLITKNAVAETIKTSIDPGDPVGSTPDGLALAPDGKTLYVANADNNDVAVIDVSDKKESRVVGFIPTGWYPSAVTVAPDGKRLFVGVGKGLYSRANAPAESGQNYTQNAKTPYDYIGRVLNGAVSVVDIPDGTQLAAYTKQVIANRPHPEATIDQAQAGRIQNDVFNKVKHVLYIIRENRTYDQVLGDLGKGNGDPNLTFFGESVTPNAHQLARQGVLLDNLYCNGEVSEDGHQWCNAAYATDFTQQAWPNSYSRRGEPRSDERLTRSPAGYIWDNCAAHGVSYRSYGEFASFESTPDAAPKFRGNKGLEGRASEAWDQALKKTGRDTDLADIFLAEMKAAEQKDNWPRFMVMHLGEDHTEGLTPGRFTPAAHVAANDVALGRIVEGISRSRFWQDTAIFVIEDDAQNGPDHVDCHRTVGLVISPYVKQGVIDSTMYSTSSMIRTMELMLGLPPMTQYDRAATPMYNSFTTEPVLTAYACIPAKVDLLAKNAATGPLARESAKLDFSDYDRADPDTLNKILWTAFKGNEPMPAPVHGMRPAF
ncbi:MAG TPA: bifunctional YncE family protein/alkaline phosphatase family protein, partial [Blastocatellia bacterium]|nr:bifunctional YncE family protein/alkaline phosphatase family protein [Blastocatellia bacterium]